MKTILKFALALLLVGSTLAQQSLTRDYSLGQAAYHSFTLSPDGRLEPVINDALALGNPGGHCVIVDKQYFVICYDTDTKVATWVGYHLTKDGLKGNASRDKEKFYPEPALPVGLRSELVDYAKSGFDRGHMAPASSFKLNAESMHATFSLANMAPQTASLNQDMWRKLEDGERELTKAHGSVWIFTGPIYFPDRPTPTIGPNHVSVPAYFYKVMFCDHPGEYADHMAAFIMPNWSARLPGSPNSYSVAVNTVQLHTDLDFFNALPLNKQIALKNTVTGLVKDAQKYRPLERAPQKRKLKLNDNVTWDDPRPISELQ